MRIDNMNSAYFRVSFSKFKFFLLAFFCIVSVMSFISLTHGAEQRPQTPKFSTDLSLAEIMESIIMPAAGVLWNAVSVDVTVDGVSTTEPETDEAWSQLRWSAVNLAAATNLLLIEGMPISNNPPPAQPPLGELTPDQTAALRKDNWQAWTAHVTVLHDVAMQAIKAIDAKDPNAISEVGGGIDAACEGCHKQFWYPEG